MVSKLRFAAGCCLYLVALGGLEHLGAPSQPETNSVGSAVAPVPPLAKSSVGRAKRLPQRVLPGGELEAVAWKDRQAPVAVRVVNTFRHGDAFRYELEFLGFEPGQYDLRQYLRRRDGTSLGELPALPVEVTAVLPAGQMLPHQAEGRPLPRAGGYRLALAMLSLVWIVGLVWLVRRWRRPGENLETFPVCLAPLTAAEQLRPLLEKGLKGHLTPQDQAQLERSLLSYWQQRLDLQKLPPPAAMAQLQADPVAGALLRQIEHWLHAPPGGAPVDVVALLAPYQQLLANTADSTVADHGTPGGAP